MVKFSVIVPFADDAATLRACVESVLAAVSKLKDSFSASGAAEILLVNGGATPQCLAAAKECVKFSSAIRLLSTSPLVPGPGGARNRALDAATGQYVMFVDADDLIEPDALARLKNETSDIVTFLPPSGTFDLTLAHNRAKLFSPMVGNLLVWNALYRRETLGDLRFPALHNYEDLVFTAGAFARASTITSGLKPWYRHINRARSLANSHHFRRVKDGFKATFLMWQNCRGAHAHFFTRLVLARKLAMHLWLHVILEAFKAARVKAPKPDDALAELPPRSFLIDARTFSGAPTGVGMYAFRRTWQLMGQHPAAKFTLLADVEGGAEIEKLRANGAELRIYGRKVYNSAAILGYLRFVCKVARELKPDVFWQPNNLQPFKVHGALRSVVTIHDIFPLEEFSFSLWHCYWRWAFGRTLANVNRLEYNSLATKKSVEARSARARALDGVVARPITEVPAKSAIKPQRRSREYFLYVGNIETRKGADILIAAYRKYREDGGRLDLVMAGKRRNVAPAPVEGIEAPGYVDDEVKFSLMLGAKALVVPSRQEGYGMQVAEGAALGVKMIISDLPVFAEIALEKDNVVFVPPGDVDALADALKRA